MNPKYVVSLEMAKKLRESGWTKKIEFWWWEDLGYSSGELEGILKDFRSLGNLDINTYYPAPLSDEILEELIKENSDKFIIKYPASSFENGIWDIQLIGKRFRWFKNKHLPDALAETWIWWKGRENES